jgi:hypothetical protein
MSRCLLVVKPGLCFSGDPRCISDRPALYQCVVLATHGGLKQESRFWLVTDSLQADGPRPALLSCTCAVPATLNCEPSNQLSPPICIQEKKLVTWPFDVSPHHTGFCNMSPCSLVGVYRRFGESLRLHAQVSPKRP